MNTTVPPVILGLGAAACIAFLLRMKSSDRYAALVSSAVGGAAPGSLR